MTNTVLITNPVPGGSKYTSTQKAHEFIARGRAVLEGGMLRFINRPHATVRVELGATEDANFWNGQPKPTISRRINIRRVYDVDCGPIIPMHLPGEVRS